jgi:hypothetical protein
MCSAICECHDLQTRSLPQCDICRGSFEAGKDEFTMGE